MDVGADDDNLVASVAQAIQAADPELDALTIAEAGDAIPGVDAQRVTFNQIIVITTVIATGGHSRSSSPC